MDFGADYYPEHVPPDLWESDASLMEKAGFTITRLAEFAWVFMEPAEGRFDFGWLDEAIDVLGRHGIRVILGTPTASMPAWAAHRYPQCLAVDRSGRRLSWGVRRNSCPSSPDYRRLSARITAAMAEHFAGSRFVIGWQTDNELGAPICYCDSCLAAFREWLKEKYATTESLNRAWGTHFWGHRYGCWDEIVFPADLSTANPSLCLDFRRHASRVTVQFQAEQIQILRKACPRHFVTHNFMGLFCEIDYADLARDLDFVSWDNYPVWEAPGIRYDAAAAADVMRGLKRKAFWIMEQTAGPPGWGVMGRNPRPGEIRHVAYQQLAHGADSQILFCWRTPTAGREQYWHGLLGHDGMPGRRYEEAAATVRELERIAPEIEGTEVQAHAAVVYDYESAWAFEIQPSYAPKSPGELAGAANYLDAVRRYHAALFRAGVAVDMIRPGDDLSSYRAVFVPHLFILGDDAARRMSDYVHRGGVLVADCRTGVKDETGLCHPRPLPGLLGEALGISIDEYEALDERVSYALACRQPFAARHRGSRFADWVNLRGAQALAGYDEWHLRPYAAVTRNSFGAGWGYYVGTIAESDTFYDELIAEVLGRSGIAPLVRPPHGVEAVVREGGGKKVLFLMNHSEADAQVQTPEGKLELLSGSVTGKSAVIEPYGVLVLKLSGTSF